MQWTGPWCPLINSVEELVKCRKALNVDLIDFRFRSRELWSRDQKILPQRISQHSDESTLMKLRSLMTAFSRVNGCNLERERTEWNLALSNTETDFPPVRTMNRLSVVCSMLVMPSSFTCTVEGLGDRISHQTNFLSSAELIMVLSVASLRSQTMDLIVPSCRPRSRGLVAASRSNRRRRFSWPPDTTLFCEDEISTDRTIWSWERVCRLAPVYVSQSFLMNQWLSKPSVRYTVKSALAVTALPASVLSFADHTAP